MRWGKSQNDTISLNEALRFYTMAPRIYADLVLGDSCTVRLKREQEARMLSERLRMDAEMKATKVKVAADVMIQRWSSKYHSANSERWVWRIVGFMGVAAGTIIVLKPP